MFVSKLSWDEWDGNHDRGNVIEVTTWDEVRSKIEALEGRFRTLVTLEGAGEVHMAIGGGAGRYVVYVTFDNESFQYLVDRSRDGGEMASIVVGGQMGEYTARRCVGLSIVLQVAQLFVEQGEVVRFPSGEATPTLWERDDVLEFA